MKISEDEDIFDEDMFNDFINNKSSEADDLK